MLCVLLVVHPVALWVGMLAVDGFEDTKDEKYTFSHTLLTCKSPGFSTILNRGCMMSSLLLVRIVIAVCTTTPERRTV